MKRIEFIPSDESIKELYDLKKKLKLEPIESWEEFYKKYKKPVGMLIG